MRQGHQGGWVAAMGIRKVAVIGILTGSMNKESLNDIIYRKMALLISSCWFFITNSLILLVSILARQAFRIFKIEDSSRKDDSKVLAMKDSRRLELVPNITELEEKDYEFLHDKETPSFSFKFQYQISEERRGSNGEAVVPIPQKEGPMIPVAKGKESSITTNISKYHFLSNKDFSEVVQEPEVKTFHVEESNIFSKTNYFYDKDTLDNRSDNSLPSAKDFQQSAVKAVDVDNFLKKQGELEDVLSTENKLLGKENATNSETSSLSEKEIGFLFSKYLQEPYVENVSIDSLNAIRKLGKSEDVLLIEKQLLEKEMALNSKTSSLGEKEVMDGTRLLSEDFSSFDSDFESLSLSDGYSVKDFIIDSGSEGLLSERDFVGYKLKSDTTGDSTKTHSYKAEVLKIHRLKEDQLPSSDAGSTVYRGCFPYIGNRINSKNIHSDDVWSENGLSIPESDKKELNEGDAESREVRKFKETRWPGSNALHVEFTDSGDVEHCSIKNIGSFRKSLDEVVSANVSANPETILEGLDERKMHNFEETSSESSNTRCDGSTGSPLRPIHLADQEDAMELIRGMDELVQKSEVGSEKKPPEKDLKKSEENNLKDLNDEDFDELESLWEHQDLIEQLKMELRKAKAIGLPTILEESESPKTVEDLKPWKIDEQFLHEDPMDELPKFYRSYRERMRNFDILNYQKMYAIGFLQLKDPLQSWGSQKPSIPTITSIISQVFWPCHRKSNMDPSEKFIKELWNDLETVYVGQTCLSWEFLRWQYEKTRELPESDPYRSHQYNQVAGEFQQFQVIVQRFIEDESFQGPRLPNYVKNRCILRNLLQVPVIEEDFLKDKMEEQRNGNDVITSEMLEDIMEESIRIFWKFVKADKDETPAILKGLVGSQVELQNPSDYEVMMDIEAILQKKEKKLKDILRTGNCLVKKFKKPKEDRPNQDLFFSQVDLKLVARVLKMSRITTDQLLWCHKKLKMITSVDRKIHREPAFLLFPC
ncbi:uncharacterized protein LOC103716422 isoform X2 [Phoenix dactylifera]|uniref:Uncharacterized protein LOC103716422 isoform X2 n=1 Tax=Phoenix dactylifera TaxID=42345 RepID=A0A8B7CMX7_PHODC|nr:uncharacterized protein LOC103716422 isoform X2 [Phoenix dactylifera]